MDQKDNRTVEYVLITVAAFLGGMCIGLMMAPRSGREMRGRLRTRLNHGGRWVEHRVVNTGGQVMEKVRQAAQEKVEQYVPTFDERPEAEWNAAYSDTARELGQVHKTGH